LRLADILRSNAFHFYICINVAILKLFWLAVHSRKIIVLVILYSVGNVLSYYALARVEVAMYTVTSQLKIFTTAIFSVVFLGKIVTGTQWRALCLLVIACILVASPAFGRGRPCPTDDEITSASAISSKPVNMDYMIDTMLGVGAILIIVTISGFSAIYFEAILKAENEKITIWERNYQLALFSSIFLVLIIVWDMSDEETQDLVFFKGWTINTVLIALIQASGGLLVAATLKYADAILKVLATAGSIVFSSTLGYAFLGGSFDVFVVLGSLSTILAIANYTLS
jgi:solute carrier family 35 (UDP-sugar transporter), member A1/2/3